MDMDSEGLLLPLGPAGLLLYFGSEFSHHLPLPRTPSPRVTLAQPVTQQVLCDGWGPRWLRAQVRRRSAFSRGLACGLSEPCPLRGPRGPAVSNARWQDRPCPGTQPARVALSRCHKYLLD